MAVVINGVVRVNGVVVGKVDGIKDGTCINLDYDRPQIVDLAKGV